MLSRTWATSRRALSRGGTWTALVWSALFVILLVAGLLLVGGNALLSAMVHPHFIGSPLMSPTQAKQILLGMLALYGVLLVVGPFFMAGIYGMFGEVVKDRPVSWGTFWSMGKKLYGRGWGLYLYLLIYAIVLGIVGGILGGLLHVVGLVVLMLAIIASFPWLLRMTAGLFVDQYTWGQSFKASFMGARYLALLGTMLLSVLFYGVILVAIFKATSFLGVFGLALYFACEMVLSIVGPVWFFALYRAAQHT